jgi:hypothetical protein
MVTQTPQSWSQSPQELAPYSSYRYPYTFYGGREIVYAYSPYGRREHPDKGAVPWFFRPCSQTVDQIVVNGYLLLPGGDPTTALLTDRMHTARLGLNDVIDQIRSRHVVYQQNIYEIQRAKCAAWTATHNWLMPQSLLKTNADPDLQDRLQDLYRQERDERTKFWQDISRIRQLLPESAQQYLSAYRKQAILRDGVGDTL